MIWLLLLTALAAGMLLPVQAGINAELRTLVGHPMLAATIQFLVGTVAIIALTIAVRSPLPEIGKLSAGALVGFGWAGSGARFTSFARSCSRRALAQQRS